MNLKQAKLKLAEASKSTSTKHAKILIADLCSVMKFLLDEIERFNALDINPDRLVGPHELPQPPWPKQSPIVPDDIPRRRPNGIPWELPSPPKPRLNAGDAE